MNKKLNELLGAFADQMSAVGRGDLQVLSKDIMSEIQAHVEELIEQAKAGAQPVAVEPEPFDKERALAGEPVCTADGQEVKGLTYFGGIVPEVSWPWAGVVGTDTHCWNALGQRTSTFLSTMDLRMAPLFETYWVNYYSKGVGTGLFADVHPTKIAARNACTRDGRARIGRKAYPVTLPIRGASCRE